MGSVGRSTLSAAKMATVCAGLRLLDWYDSRYGDDAAAGDDEAPPRTGGVPLEGGQHDLLLRTRAMCRQSLRQATRERHDPLLR